MIVARLSGRLCGLNRGFRLNRGLGPEGRVAEVLVGDTGSRQNVLLFRSHKAFLLS